MVSSLENLETIQSKAGDFLEIVADRDYKSGEIRVVGDIVGQAAADFESGEMASYRIEGMIKVNANSAVIPAGTRVFWDDANKYIVTSSVGNKQAGYTAQDFDANTNFGWLKLERGSGAGT